MNVLWDTNALLWAAYAPGRLSAAAERAFFQADQVFVSVVSFWEIGMKMSRGGFTGLGIPVDWELSLERWMKEQGFEVIPVELAHCRALQDLPFHHKDPFDRMLIVQALRRNLPVVGSDRVFETYGVKRIW